MDKVKTPRTKVRGLYNEKSETPYRKPQIATHPRYEVVGLSGTGAKYYLPPLLFMAFIFYLSSRQRVEVSDVYLIQFAIFKSLHIIEYAILYVLNYRALRNLLNRQVWKNHIDAFIITVFYAFTDEIHQVLVPTREGRMRDVVIDIIGITLALWLIWKKLPTAQQKLKNWARKLEIL